MGRVNRGPSIPGDPWQYQIGLDYDKIYEEVMERMMATPAHARQTSLHLRTRYELKCLDHFESYEVMAINTWKEKYKKDVQNLGQRQVVLLAHPRNMPMQADQEMRIIRQVKEPVAICFLYTWDAGEKALDALMANNRGVIDLRELLVEGAPEVDDDLGKEGRVIDLGGPAVTEPTQEQETPFDMQRELQRILREQSGPPVRTMPHPMIPPQDGEMYRSMLVPNSGLPNRNGDIIQMNGVSMSQLDSGELRVEPGENITLYRRPDGQLEVVAREPSNGQRDGLRGDALGAVQRAARATGNPGFAGVANQAMQEGQADARGT